MWGLPAVQPRDLRASTIGATCDTQPCWCPEQNPNTDPHTGQCPPLCSPFKMWPTGAMVHGQVLGKPSGRACLCPYTSQDKVALLGSLVLSQCTEVLQKVRGKQN